MNNNEVSTFFVSILLEMEEVKNYRDTKIKCGTFDETCKQL